MSRSFIFTRRFSNHYSPVMESVADLAQVWIVTHAPKLVTAAPLSAILHMSPTDGTDKNQLTKASDEELRGQLLSDLGVHPVDVLQSDSLLVVEGHNDATRLRAALSLPLSRSIIYVAGNAEAVEATAATLQSARQLIPWIAVRDRDLLSEEDVQRRLERTPGLFIWPYRTLKMSCSIRFWSRELYTGPVVESRRRKCERDYDS